MGDEELPLVVRSAAAMGAVVRAQRQTSGLRQIDLAGIGNTGNRLIVDIEKGKPTVQLQKVLDVLDLLGLELVVRHKASTSL
ncbi:hypothetical protein BH10PSE18_BH10PSE18_39750 [soil metagenome]